MITTNKVGESNFQNNPQLQFSNYLLSNSSAVFETEINDLSSSPSSKLSLKTTPPSILNSNINCSIQPRFTPNNSLTISSAESSLSTSLIPYSEGCQLTNTNNFVQMNQYQCSSQNNHFYNLSSSHLAPTNNFYDSIDTSSILLYVFYQLSLYWSYLDLIFSLSLWNNLEPTSCYSNCEQFQNQSSYLNAVDISPISCK
jgi:hypothetical protein